MKWKTKRISFAFEATLTFAFLFFWGTQVNATLLGPEITVWAGGVKWQDGPCWDIEGVGPVDESNDPCDAPTLRSKCESITVDADAYGITWWSELVDEVNVCGFNGPSSYSLSISPGGTGVKIKGLDGEDVPLSISGSGGWGMTWVVSEPKKSGTITITATATGNCFSCGEENGNSAVVATIAVELDDDDDDSGGSPGGGPGCGS
jgi:hypothetical protein